MVTTGHWQTESRNNPLCCFIGGHISVAVNTTIRGHLTNMAEGLTFIQGWHVWSADITQGLKPSSNFYISIPQTWLKSKKDNSPKHKQGKVEHNEIHNKKLPAQNTQKDNLSTFTHHSPAFLSGTKKQKRLRRSSFICANSTAVTVRSWFSSVRLTSLGVGFGGSVYRFGSRYMYICI